MFALFILLISFSIAIVSHTEASPKLVVDENTKPGTPSNEWDVNGCGDRTIQGFAVPFAINIGESVDFRINTTSSKWRIDIYRVGYYQGHGARKITTIIQNSPSPQPECRSLPEWRTVSCNNWSPTYTFNTKDFDLISGVYFARLTRLDIDKDHPLYNWRVDNSYIAALDQFCEGDCDIQPKPSKHNYGASGHGQSRIRLKEPYASHLYFIIRDDDSQSDIMMQTADTTWMAYNKYGGSSTYGTFDPLDVRKRALKMSYNRPIITRDYRAINMLFSAEYSAIRFLEKNGFDVTYISGLDMGTLDESTMKERMKRHKVFLSVGHDEYWSMQQRRLVTDGIRKDGVNAMFWSGNEMYWKVRFEADHQNGTNAENTGNPRMVIFKETRQRPEKLDTSSTIWTGTWRDEHPAFAEHEGGPFPENAVTGQLYTVDVWRADPIHIPWFYAKHKFWRNCDSINSMEIGDSDYVLRKPLIGHEFDEDIDNGFRPPGLQHLSETTIDNVQYLLDWGTMYDTGSAQHHLTVYKHPESKAIVFGAGSIIFAWGLDAHHDSATGIPPHDENYYDVRVLQDGYGPIKEVQQAMFNLFADMGCSQPLTMEKGFVFEKYDESDVAAPMSWVNNDKKRNRKKLRYDPVAEDKQNGMRCVRIEGASRTGFGDSIVAGIEVTVGNEYIFGEKWAVEPRWFAATIDYEQIASDHVKRKGNRVSNWPWYFEAWIDGEMKEALHVQSRATNDNGDIEVAGAAQYATIESKSFKPCAQKDWIWRKRPILLKYDTQKKGNMKGEL